MTNEIKKIEKEINQKFKEYSPEIKKIIFQTFSNQKEVTYSCGNCKKKWKTSQIIQKCPYCSSKYVMLHTTSNKHPTILMNDILEVKEIMKEIYINEDLASLEFYIIENILNRPEKPTPQHHWKHWTALYNKKIALQTIIKTTLKPAKKQQQKINLLKKITILQDNQDPTTIIIPKKYNPTTKIYYRIITAYPEAQKTTPIKYTKHQHHKWTNQIEKWTTITLPNQTTLTFYNTRPWQKPKTKTAQITAIAYNTQTTKQKHQITQTQNPDEYQITGTIQKTQKHGKTQVIHLKINTPQLNTNLPIYTTQKTKHKKDQKITALAWLQGHLE